MMPTSEQPAIIENARAVLAAESTRRSASTRGCEGVMAAGERRTIREPRTDRPADLILWLRLEPGEIVKGGIGPAGGSEVVELHGWIDFMAAIDLLRAEAVGPREERPAS